MKTILFRRLSAALAVLALTFFSLPSVQADPLVVPAGHDLFETIPGIDDDPDPGDPDSGTWADAPPLPPGFFGTQGGFPSDPTPPQHRIWFRGNPTGPLGFTPGLFQIPVPFDENALLAQHGILPYPLGGPLSEIDTIVQRGGTTLPNVGDSGVVPIEIVSLSLVSIAPITVTYGGGAGGISFFDVFVDLNPGPQSSGTMTLTRTHQDGGTFDSVLPVQARLTFVNTQPTGPAAVSPVPFGGVFSAFDVPWIVVPEPSTGVLLGLASCVLVVTSAARRLRRGCR